MRDMFGRISGDIFEAGNKIILTSYLRCAMYCAYLMDARRKVYISGWPDGNIHKVLIIPGNSLCFAVISYHDLIFISMPKYLYVPTR